MLFALYTLLGIAVSSRPPASIDSAIEQAFVGAATPLAIVFTQSGRLPVLGSLGVLALILAVAVPSWRERAIFSIAITLVGWKLSDVMKDLFQRPRPENWLVFHETSYAYSSGHAMFAVLVYGLWAYFVWRSELPRELSYAVASLLTLWAGGVVWSRLALGAHYPSDLAGGVLLGLAIIATGAAVLGHFPAAGRLAPAA